MSFSPLERILLSLLILATVSFFTRDISRKIRIIRRGPSERMRHGGVGRRLGRVFHEVLLQEKVIGGRKVAGGMHAMVFFGFLFFAFETLDHFLMAYGLGYLQPLLGGKLSIFHDGLAVVAVLVAVAICGLAIRRFFMPRYSPDPKAYSSAWVAVLIFFLMLTYLYDLTEPAGLVARINWWLHAAMILVFPHLILRSKHFHLILAPVNIFFKNWRIGDYEALNLDLEALEEMEEEPTFGLEKLSVIPWKMRMDFFSCVECKRCTDQCPAATCGQALDPRELMLDGRSAVTFASDEDPFIGKVISEEALGECTTCGACESICPVGNEHLLSLLGAKRAQALALGTGMVATEFLQAIENYGNPFSAPADARKELAEKLEIPIFEKGKSQVLLWLGCVWGCNEDARSSVTAMVEVLREAGVDYGILPAESCCGHHSRRQGEEMQFQTLAAQNLELLKESGAENIVTPCPHCMHTLTKEYSFLDESFHPRVIHHSQLLESLLAEGRLKLDRGKAPAGKVTYHDPCYLGRYEGIYSEPRKVIAAAGASITEMERHGERTYCCGGGSAGFIREQKVDRRIDQERKDEILATGAETLVTSCPECKMMLDAATSRTLDLAEWVAESMERTQPQS